MNQNKQIRLSKGVARVTFSVLLFLGFSLPASADWYGAIDFGKTELNEDICGALGAIGFTPCSEDLEDSGWKLSVGNELNKNAAVEFGYVDLGDASVSAAGVTCSADSKGFHGSVVGILPTTDKFSVTGRLGLFFWDAEVTCSAGAASASEDDSGTDLTFGIGIRYDFNKSMGIRAGYDRFDVDEDDVDMLSLGVVFKFK